MLVEAKSNVNASNTSKLTPLHFASQSNEKITEYLIANGALVNAEDANGRTPLHHAALFNKVKVAQILVKAGAIIDKLDNATKYSPLQLAIKTNQYEGITLVKILLCNFLLKINSGTIFTGTRS